MADRSVVLFEAIYATLAADAGVTSALGGTGRIYDNVPAGAACPYVVIGDETAIDAGGTAWDAQEHTLTIHAWSEAASSKQVKQIMAAVRAALHDAPPALSGGTCANLRQEFKETFRDPDGVTWHGVMRFRAVTHD